MTNDYYVERFQGREHQLAVAMHTESELRQVQEAFDLLPAPSALAGGGLLFVTTSGRANEYVVRLPVLTTLIEGLNFLVNFHEPNAGASTIDVNGLGEVEIVTLLGEPVDANDLRDIRRLTYFDSRFIMQSVAGSDLYRIATEVTSGIVRGAPGLPGASTLIAYDLLLEQGAFTQGGQWRLLLGPDATTGVTSHAGLRSAEALELYEFDQAGQGRVQFYDEVEAGDIVVLFVSQHRWYAYTIVAARAAVHPASRLWEISPLVYEATDGIEPLALDSQIIFRWSRARARSAGVDGVTGDAIVPDSYLTFHSVPADYTSDPLTWPVHPGGALFRNNMGPEKAVVCTIVESGTVLSAAEHAGYLFEWFRDGSLWVPAVTDPINAGEQQLRSRRYIVVSAADVADGAQNQFSCRACLA